MAKVELSGSSGRNDWPVRLSGAAGGMVGGAVGMFVVKPLIDLPPGLGPFAFVALIGVALTLYLLTPEIYQTVRQALPGAVFFALGWLGSTYLFRVYVEQFARYGENYLSFSSLIVLLTWIYVTSLLLLLGGRLNIIIRQEWLGENTLAPAA